MFTFWRKEISELQSQAINEFGINVFNAISAAIDANNVISPLSLSTALGMIHLGANGETNNELRQVLGYNKYNIFDNEAHNAYKYLLQQISVENSNQYVLNIANRVMAQIDFDILANYSNLLKINYDASIQSVDFAKNGQNAIKVINEWISDKTSGKILSLFDSPLPPHTRLAIVNAVYLKGKWLYEFDAKHTKEETFINNGMTKANVKIMHMYNTEYRFTTSKELYADILEMPYIGGHISMYIVLPHTVNGLQKTASALTEQKFNSDIKSMSDVKIVDLSLPKFKMEASYTLMSALQSLGLNNIFTDSADLSGIDGQRNLFVSDVVHKVFLEVNEEGSESAAATGVLQSLSCSLPPPPRDFKVDHPFIFVIRDNKHDVNLFFGQITQL